MVNNIRIKGWWMEVMVCMNMAMYDGVDENREKCIWLLLPSLEHFYFPKLFTPNYWRELNMQIFNLLSTTNF